MRGQITILDLLMVPLVAIVLSIIAMTFLGSTVSNLLQEVYLQPIKTSCTFILANLFSTYYIHSAYELQYLQQYYPDEYQAYMQNLQSFQNYTGIGNFRFVFATYSGVLENNSNPYVVLIRFLAPPVKSEFKEMVDSEYALLQAEHASLFISSIYPMPSNFVYRYLCSAPVFNPANSTGIYYALAAIS
jgi:hypothetical protein